MSEPIAYTAHFRWLDQEGDAGRLLAVIIHDPNGNEPERGHGTVGERALGPGGSDVRSLANHLLRNLGYKLVDQSSSFPQSEPFLATVEQA